MSLTPANDNDTLRPLWVIMRMMRFPCEPRRPVNYDD